MLLFVFIPSAALSSSTRKWAYCGHHKVALSWTPRAARLLTEIHLGWGWVHSGKRWGGQSGRMDCWLKGFGRPADLLNTHFKHNHFLYNWRHTISLKRNLAVRWCHKLAGKIKHWTVCKTLVAIAAFCLQPVRCCDVDCWSKRGEEAKANRWMMASS